MPSGGVAEQGVLQKRGRGPRQNTHNPIPLDRGVQFWRRDFRVPLYLVLVTSEHPDNHASNVQARWRIHAFIQSFILMEQCPVIHSISGRNASDFIH